MSGQTMNINYHERREMMKEYIETHDPYQPVSSSINLHALSEYARQNNIPLAEIKEEDIQKFMSL